MVTKLRQIGYFPQKLELLAGTIRDNIARFDGDAQDEDVIEAACIAGVHEMILQLPDGYATQLGFGSAPLSGGQLQRIGLARAIFGKPRYVILDEPNSNLDAAGDDALSQAIVSLRERGSTVVVMAHRPSAISAVNKVLVLHSGRVAEFGDKEKILQKTVRPPQSKPAPSVEGV
ncbi:ATP-binding cassette domain-containing protein [Ruegeria sp. SCP11]|uniref:ATP-binding cassette domain-containing protein n=1 Tax=Ruegeria sp. SCP11 TaxID=3141378 RepID=UPI0033355DB0